MILAFSSGITYAFYVLYYTKSDLTALDPYKLSIYLSAFGSALLLAAALATGQMVIRLPLKAWGMIIGFAFMVSFLATVFFQIGAKKIGPEKASLLSTFEPLTSVLAGVAFPRRADDGKNSSWRRMHFGVGGAADGQRAEAAAEGVEKENYTYSV